MMKIKMQDLKRDRWRTSGRLSGSVLIRSCPGFPEIVSRSEIGKNLRGPYRCRARFQANAHSDGRGSPGPKAYYYSSLIETVRMSPLAGSEWIVPNGNGFDKKVYREGRVAQ
jgi:hypothetical protein